MVSNLKLFIFRATLLILFSVSLFFVLFLANGYKYDFVSNLIRKTGIIDVNFSDKLAVVALDGLKLDGKLPFVASNVLPGKYNLVITREGFWDWSRQIVVEENFISKVENVLLYPLDEHFVSKVLLETLDLKPKYWLRNGYFFKVDGKNLAYGKLTDALAVSTLFSIELPGEDLNLVDVQLNKAVLVFADKKRLVLDLDRNELTSISEKENLIFAADKWIYFKNNLLAVFDSNLQKVQFSKEFLKSEIVDVKYIKLKGDDFLLVTMKGQKAPSLYYYLNQDLVEIAKNVKNAPLLNAQGNFVFLNSDNELWEYDRSKAEKHYLSRFSSDIDLKYFVLNKDKTSGQMIWSEAGNLNIADIELTNSRQMFRKNQIIDFNLGDDGRVYYLEQIQTDASESTKKLRLMVMDLDI